jgi:hypothetical protein
VAGHRRVQLELRCRACERRSHGLVGDRVACATDGLRTSPRGTVVVTTRRPTAGRSPKAEVQHIGVLPRQDAARVLRDLAPHSGTQQEAARTADRLGRLALALTPAGGSLSPYVLDHRTRAARGHVEAAVEEHPAPFGQREPHGVVDRERPPHRTTDVAASGKAAWEPTSRSPSPVGDSSEISHQGSGALPEQADASV